MTPTPFSLEGRVAIVTGATGLLGRQHCRALADAGAHVVVADMDARRCDEIVEMIHQQQLPRALAVTIDVTDGRSLHGAARTIMESLGRIDILVNNAAVNDAVEGPKQGENSRFEQFPLELWKKSLDVNVTGTFLCCQVFGRHMMDAQHGSIINIASTYGLVAPDQSLYRRPDGTQEFFKGPAYPTTKGAVLAFTRFLAAYWGGMGVRVNALSPGGVQNGQDDYFIAQYSKRTPLARMAEPSDYRGALVFLASDASSYMTGANLVVDGGWTIW